MVIRIFVKHRKTKFKGPFYIQVISLAIADLLLFVYHFITDFLQFMFDFGHRFNPINPSFKYLASTLLPLGSVAAAPMQTYIALLRLLAVAVPNFAKVRLMYFELKCANCHLFIHGAAWPSWPFSCVFYFLQSEQERVATFCFRQ